MTVDALKKRNHVFTSRYVGHKMKVRTFDMYVGSVFLHNTETWAVNKTLLDRGVVLRPPPQPTNVHPKT